MKMKSILLLSVASILVFGASSSPADVLHWRVIKGAYYLQDADNTPATTTTNWGIFGIVETEDPGDAASVVITGGNIVGSMAYDLEGSEWELGADYTTKTALDAVFPSDAAYSIILSGGSLGTVTQQFSIATDAYPNTPYLTGADYSDCLALEALEPFELNWNNAGTTTTVSLQVNTGSELDEGDTLVEIYSNAYTSVEMPWNLFVANSNYNGYIDFANATQNSGTGGFGVDGDVSFNTSLAFHIDTVNTAAGFDDFDLDGMDAGKWSVFGSEFGDAFTNSAGRLNYTSPGSGDSFVAWAWDASELSYTQDWSIAIDITDQIPSGAFSGDEESYFGVLVMADGNLDNNISGEFVNDMYGRQAATYVTSGGVEDVIELYTPVFEETIAVKISFDADTKMLYTAYSTGGDYIIQASYSAANWGMTDTSVFNPAVFSGSYFFEVTNGQIYADNFRIFDGGPISNEVSLIELEYNRDYEFPDTPVSGRQNWHKLDFETSHRVETISVLTAAGETVSVTGNEDITTGLEWYFETTDPITTPWDPANDGDWTITVGYNNGTFQSTVVPFTQADGTTPIPVMNNQPLFTLPGSSLTTNATSILLEWNAPDINANHIGIDEWPDEDGQDIAIFADSLTDEIGVVPTIHGPLSTTSTNIALHAGTNWLLLVNGWGRTAYNADGIGYIVVKLSESDYIINVTDDIDGDNMDDSWEIGFFGSTNAVNGGALDDFDLDGMSNVDEFISGVNPTNSGSVFGVNNSEPAPAGFMISWNAVAGREYRVYWAKTLTNAFESVTPGYLPYPQNSYTDTVHTVEGCGFYYIDVQLQD